MKTVVVFISVIGLAWCQTSAVQPCVINTQDPAQDLPINTYIVGCETPPCTFVHHSTAEIRIVFQARRQSRRLRTLAFAYLFGALGTQYDLGDESDTCNYLTNTYCPILENEVVQYTLRMPIEPWMPAGTRATIEFVIQDEADKSTVVCLRTPIVISRN